MGDKGRREMSERRRNRERGAKRRRGDKESRRRGFEGTGTYEVFRLRDPSVPVRTEGPMG